MDAVLRLRAARPDDAAEIARLADELGYPTSVSDMHERLGMLLPQQRNHVVVAEGSCGLLGWIAVERRLTLESGERIEIIGLVVGAAARQGGVGRRLVAGAEQWAVAQGFDAIGVRSNVARDESHPFYECLGYVCCKTQHVYRRPLVP